MTTDPPVACSLSATALSARLAAMAALGRDALLDVRSSDATARLRFAPSPGVRARVDAMVAAEAQCCAFLAMTVAEGADAVTVTIEAPGGAEAVLQDLVAAFTAGRAAC